MSVIHRLSSRLQSRRFSFTTEDRPPGSQVENPVTGRESHKQGRRDVGGKVRFGW